MRLGILFLAIVLAGAAWGADELTLNVIRKTASRSNARERGNTSVEKNEIVFTVKVTSRALKELNTITLVYNIYYEMALLGSAAKPQVQTLTGKQEMPKLLPGKVAEFDTTPITLKKATLDGNYYFSSGAGNQTKDKVVGMWFKAFDAEGKQIADYRQPSNIEGRYKWEQP